MRYEVRDEGGDGDLSQQHLVFFCFFVFSILAQGLLKISVIIYGIRHTQAYSYVRKDLNGHRYHEPVTPEMLCVCSILSAM